MLYTCKIDDNIVQNLNTMKKNILIVGGTSGIIIPCLKSFIKKYNVYATYSKRDSLKNVHQNIISSKKVKFIKTV